MDFQINTSQDFLDQNGLTLDDVKGFVEFLYRLFGKKYNQFLPVNIQTQDIFFLQGCVETFRKIQHCDGYEKLIANFNKQEFRSHYFTARSEERRVGKECRYRWSPYH